MARLRCPLNGVQHTVRGRERTRFASLKARPALDATAYHILYSYHPALRVVIIARAGPCETESVRAGRKGD